MLFRIRPDFARKNLYMLISLKMPRKPRLFLPLPLFVIDELEDSLALFWAVFPKRTLSKVSRRIPYLGQLLTSSRALVMAYRELRWKGAFTLIDVDLGVTGIKVSFI